jgi:hypothetical protein
MNEVNPSANPEEPLNGKIVEHDLADRTVAFFVALSDPKVDKDWSELGKTLAVVVPAVIAVAATRGRATGGIRNLIGPGIALGKLVKDVNGQVTPEHLQKAHNYVEQAKTTAAVTLATAKARTARRSNS